MALIILLPLFLNLLHLFAGVCFGRVDGDDPINLEMRVFTNPYLPVNSTFDNWSTHKVILALAEKGQCMSYTTFEASPLQSLASCELYCFMNGGFNTWDCIAPEFDTSNEYWKNAFTDELLFQWSPGKCSCSNTTSPTPSVFGDDDDDNLPASSPGELRPAIKVPSRQVRELSQYGYAVEVGTHVVIDPQPGWNYGCITWTTQPPAQAGQQAPVPQTSVIGTFALMINGVNNGVLRVHEAWAARDNRPSGQRAAFYDDVINFWRMYPGYRNLNLLTEVRFDTVIEDTLCNAVGEVYQMMGANIAGPLMVFRNGAGANENNAFNYIMQRARFARSMQRAINEYVEFAGRTIEGFYFTMGFAGFDFAIYFNGYNPATIGDATWEWV
ncbi:hypothetical protein KVR01_006687 [Diaporthe batatas]|uniref:uncharacterized protein n=1 Tax=Diaporthe batatas TaxID=748121 RepID=UPI001D05AAC7|nr:uncharacterized protein KVR01_006687 [Diaporthe batatas]KAG8163390.1 hypothetical protein KVR01_006687 [Diaporthe batatas]